MTYPIKLAPIYRHGIETPWGGQALMALYNKLIPDDTTGEALEVSALKDMSSTVVNGEFAGHPLSDVFNIWKSDLTGADYDIFPLMVKFIDARRALSVQVHPCDAYAFKNEGKPGKNECWVILDAGPGAEIVCGLKPGCGDTEKRLVRMAVKPGDVIYIPSGTVHALGGGIVVYELQQSSDVTYRIYDWGSARPLHIKKAMDVINHDHEAQKIAGEAVELPGAVVTYYIDNEFFCLARAQLQGGLELSAGTMRIVTALGELAIETSAGNVNLLTGETAIIPASLTEARLTGRAQALIASTAKRMGG